MKYRLLLITIISLLALSILGCGSREVKDDTNIDSPLTGESIAKNNDSPLSQAYENEEFTQITPLVISERRFHDMTNNNPNIIQVGDIILSMNMTLKEMVSVLRDVTYVDEIELRTSDTEDVSILYLSDGSLEASLDKKTEIYNYAMYVYIGDTNFSVLFSHPDYEDTHGSGWGLRSHEAVNLELFIPTDILVSECDKIEVRYMGLLFGNHFDNGALQFTRECFNSIKVCDKLVAEFPEYLYYYYKDEFITSINGIMTEDSDIVVDITDPICALDPKTGNSTSIYYLDKAFFSKALLNDYFRRGKSIKGNEDDILVE